MSMTQSALLTSMKGDQVDVLRMTKTATVICTQSNREAHVQSPDGMRCCFNFWPRNGQLSTLNLQPPAPHPIRTLRAHGILEYLVLLGRSLDGFSAAGANGGGRKPSR